MNHMEQEQPTNAELLSLVKKYEQMLFDKGQELKKAQTDAKRAQIEASVIRKASDTIKEIVRDTVYKLANGANPCKFCEFYHHSENSPPCNECCHTQNCIASYFVWRDEKFLKGVINDES